MEATHRNHDGHMMTKTNYVLHTARKEISGKTSRTLVWDCNQALGPKQDKMKKKTFQKHLL
jgi:hypothetical protein